MEKRGLEKVRVPCAFPKGAQNVGEKHSPFGRKWARVPVRVPEDAQMLCFPGLGGERAFPVPIGSL